MSYIDKILSKIGGNCGNCIHCKTDENGNNYCEEKDVSVDMITIPCELTAYEQEKEEN